MVFNTPGASHHGAVYERLIRSFRKIFNGVAREQRLTDETLATLACKVEAILNSRPLTTVSDDVNDLEPLTPNHLLLLKAPNSLPPGVFQNGYLHSRKLWRQVQYLANLFWSRWVKEYAPTLQTRQRWTRSKPNLAPEGLVLVCDSSLPRGTWPMGRILDVFSDSAGHVRTAKVKTKDTTLVRPITKLVLLLAQETESV